ncbi:hypothetical protein [Mycobacterium heidelbergense]|nr:hypothetical protein [Mycobacterium heidelbergense]
MVALDSPADSASGVRPGWVLAPVLAAAWALLVELALVAAQA